GKTNLEIVKGLRGGEKLRTDGLLGQAGEPPVGQYDAYTTPLHACIGGLQIGEVYHIKLAIADVSDQILDSGVFLSGNSFVQACTDQSRDTECLLCEIAGHVTYTEQCGTLILNNTSQINLATTACRYEIGEDVVLPSCDGSIEHTFDAPGTYTIKLIYEVGAFYSTFTIGDVYVSNTPPAQPVIQQNGTTLSVSNVESEASYQWYLNGAIIAEATSPVYEASESGTYQVTAVNGCLSASNTFNMTISGVQESLRHSMLIYPNPAESIFTIQYAAGTDQIKVLDLAGRTVFASATNGKNTESINLSPGVYTVITRNDLGVSTGVEKVIVR
ncbi:MAG: choice-of-anchor L domain-containing protein, partial [Flavobacteriales bacterium]